MWITCRKNFNPEDVSESHPINSRVCLFSFSLRASKEHPMPQWLIMLITQLTTMLLIGLWHGVTVNYVIWGLWHGIGLFVHQLYSRRTSAWLRSKGSAFQKVYTLCSTCFTILYVTLGWIWFVVPDFPAAVQFFGRLF